MKKLIRVTSVPLSVEKLLGNQLSFMNEFYEVTAVSSDEEQLKKIAGRLNVKYFSVEMTRSITPFKDLKAIYRMYCFFKKKKPDIVHSHTPKAGLVAMIAAFLARIPVRMHTVAGLPLLETVGMKRQILNMVEIITYRFATKVYPNSHGLFQIILKEKFCTPKKLQVLANGSSNGIDTDYFSVSQISDEQQDALKKELKISKSDFVFIFVGRMVKDKGINELVAAFNELKKLMEKEQNSKSVKLILVGPLEEQLDPLLPETLAEIKSDENILMMDFQEDVRPFFAISDALVFPSYREGFPNVVLQAGAMELPSIVTDINGCNEIIEHQHNGIIIPVKDKEAVLQSMKLLLENAELTKWLKENSRKRITDNYQQLKVWQAILSEYQKESDQTK